MSDNMSLENIFIHIISVAISGGALSDDVKPLITEDTLVSLYELGEKHHITHIIADVLLREKLIQNHDIQVVYRTNILSSINKAEKISKELSILADFFEKNKIDHIPLKGSVIRNLYPRDWYRSSSDIDILVRKEDLERTRELFQNELKYSFSKEGPHDVSFVSENKVNVELHFDLVEKDGQSIGREYRRWNAAILDDAFDRKQKRDGYEYCYLLDNVDFCVYHIAHMAKHFEKGGCGIRSIIDLYLMDKKGLFGKDTKRALSHSGLDDFFDVTKRLSLSWFEGMPCDEDISLVGEYILNGGVFGNSENKSTLGSVSKGGKLRYIMSRFFMPYDLLKTVHPILEKHKWMYPVFVAKRWFKVFSPDAKDRVTKELSYHITCENAEKTKRMINKLGL